MFDSAARVAGDGRAPAIFDYVHNTNDEVTCLPNDGISVPETGRQIVSYQSVAQWLHPTWRTGYAGLAYSENGNDFVRSPDAKRWNSASNDDPYQMWSMQRDGEWVYIFSVKAGHQPGPMMLRRVRWREMLNPPSYEGWGWNGSAWAWGRPCSPILHGCFAALRPAAMQSRRAGAAIGARARQRIRRWSSLPVSAAGGVRCCFEYSVPPEQLLRHRQKDGFPKLASSTNNRRHAKV